MKTSPTNDRTSLLGCRGQTAIVRHGGSRGHVSRSDCRGMLSLTAGFFLMAFLTAVFLAAGFLAADWRRQQGWGESADETKERRQRLPAFEHNEGLNPPPPPPPLGVKVRHTFLAVVFLAVVFLAAGFLAVVFFLAAGFFLAVVFLAADFFLVAFLAVAFLAAGFLAAVFLAACGRWGIVNGSVSPRSRLRCIRSNRTRCRARVGTG